MSAASQKVLSERDQSPNSQPLVSVICATFNQQQYIHTCLDAVLAQVTDFDVEVIVHDDASTDGTADIVRSYAEKYPDKIRAIIQPNRIYSTTKRIRLDLYQYTRGRYVALCDGDDFWRDPYKLLKQVRLLEANPQFVLSYHNADVVDGDGNTIRQYARPQTVNLNFDHVVLRTFSCGWIPLPAMMHRRIELDYPPEFDLSPNSDNFLVMLLGKYGGAAFQPDIESSAVRHHRSNYFSSRSHLEKDQMHLQTHLQMVSYLLRIGEAENARFMLTNTLAGMVRSYLTTLETMKLGSQTPHRR
ncbi:MAG: glycosyltransferase [Hydrogenophilales bacterium]|nr:glycosyltransferase [Hydrogenophilales bacterium]